MVHLSMGLAAILCASVNADGVSAAVLACDQHSAAGRLAFHIQVAGYQASSVPATQMMSAVC